MDEQDFELPDAAWAELHINAAEPEAAAYWATLLGASVWELTAAVSLVGNQPNAVEAMLGLMRELGVSSHGAH